ncbi:MAG: C25 family cysteine peptidase [Planctomycetota bacterium]
MVRRLPVLSLVGTVLLLLFCLPRHRGFSDDEPTWSWYRPPEGVEQVEYVIITGRSLVQAWAPLRDWKSRVGIPADIVAVEDILGNPLYQGVDGPETLRNFLKDLYWKWGLSWVLLGGDVNIVPTRFLDLMERTACDIYFACLEGTWNEDGDAQFGSGADRVVQQADLFLGRVPVETPGEVHAFLTKYFHYIKPLHRDYQKRILCIGAVLGNDYRWDADDHYDYLETEYLRPAGFKTTHLEQTDFLRGRFELDPKTKKCSGYLFGPTNRKAGDALRAKAIEEGNKGYGFISHYAHSNTYAMGLPRGGLRNADARRFTNLERPTVFYSTGCHVNQYDQESISEELLLHPGGGAVAFIGCTVNSYAYQNFYERDFFEALFRHGEYRIGRVFEASKIRRNARNFAGKNPVTVLNRGLALLGDPHMPLWSETPRDLTVQFENPRPGQDALEVRVADPDGKPVPKARAALAVQKQFFSRADADDEGKIRLPLPKRPVEEILLTVTARNFIPLERTLTLSPKGPRLLPFDIALEAGPDARLNPGENVEITVAVKNEGDQAANNVTLHLSTTDPHVKAGAQTVKVPDVEPGGVALPASGFSFTVKPEAPLHHRATFTLRIQTGNTTLWEDRIRLSIHTPFLVLAGHRIERKGNSDPAPLRVDDAGTTVDFHVALANLGSGPATGIRVQLECPHESVTVKSDTQTIPRIIPGTREACPAPFSLDMAAAFRGGPVEFVLKISTGVGPPREEIFTLREPPPAPKGLKGQGGEASVYLAWEPVQAERPLAGYMVFRASAKEGSYVPVALTPVSSSCFEDRGLSAQSVYTYRVCALDRDLNPSAPTTPIHVSTTFPLQRDWPKKAKSPVIHVSVCDVDGDGDLEIATGDKGGVWIWHHTGAELRHGGDFWTFGLFKELQQGGISPTFADLDGDGKMEVLTAGRFKDSQVYVFTLDGEPFAGWPKKTRGRLMTPPQVADLDGDGAPEIVFHEGFSNNLYVWRRDGTAYNVEGKGKKKKPKEIIAKTDRFTYFLSTIVDLDGDGVKDIVGIGGRGTVYALRPDGKMHDGFPVKNSGPLGSTAPVGDIDGDGAMDIVFVAKGGTLLCALEANGVAKPNFPMKIRGGKPQEGQSLPILADLDGAKGLEIVLGGRDGNVFVVNGQGKTLPGFPKKLPKEAFGASVGDIDGDRKPEIIVGCADGCLYAFESDGKPLRGFPLKTGGPVRGVPVIADIDGDGDVEIAAGSQDGYVYIWDLAGQADPGRVAWPMYGGDSMRAGVPGSPPPSPPNPRIQGTDKARIMWRALKVPRSIKIKGYHVYRGEGGILRRITPVPTARLSLLDASIVPGRQYFYAVTAVDQRGRESCMTDPVPWGEKAAGDLFKKAEKFEKRNRFREAIRTYEELIKKYAASRFAAEAKKRLERLASDTEVQKAIEKKKADSWCRGMMALARTWEKSSKPAKAAECYRKVIDKYPDSTWAVEAKKALEALEKK